MARRYVPKRIHPNMGRPKKPRVSTGRPSKYNPVTTDEMAKSLAQLGYNDTEMAQKLGISRQLYYTWQERFPTFLDGIRKGRLQNATGLSYKALTKALEGGIRTKTRNIRVKNPDGSLRETREEIEAAEIWPCKDTALKHLAATDPAYKGIQDKAEAPVWIQQLNNNLTAAADGIKASGEVIDLAAPQGGDNDDK